MTTEVAEKLYYRIGEVESITGIPAYVLRYWESEFKLLRPKKNPAGQRLYRPRDLELVQRIKTLLYEERLTLEGAKKRLISESRRTDQLELGMKEATYAETLKRIRDRLGVLRARLGPEAAPGYLRQFTPEGRGVAQPGSAHDWGSWGRRFKSSRPDHFPSQIQALCRSYSSPTMTACTLRVSQRSKKRSPSSGTCTSSRLSASRAPAVTR